MKWRNQMLALVCLALFGAFGVFYFRTWVVQKPFAIILFVGEGLSSQRLASARLYNGGADSVLAIDELEFTARLKNFSADFAVPDAAAAASALATGIRAKNGELSQKDDGSPAPTLLELAHERGRSTGLVTDGDLANPTSAAFYAHGAKTDHFKALIATPTLDLAFGGARAIDSPGSNFRLVKNASELEALPTWPRARVLGLFAEGDFPFSNDVAARANKPALSDLVREAILLLQQNRRGYVLVVNAHLMGVAAAQNEGEHTLQETIELDRAVQVARDYAGESAAIVVAGNVAIGGMNVSGFPYRKDSGVAILGLNSSGQSWITWATGPNARVARPLPLTDNTNDAEPAAVSAATGLNTLDDPTISAIGLRMEGVRGTMPSNEIFLLLRDVL